MSDGLPAASSRRSPRIEGHHITVRFDRVVAVEDLSVTVNVGRSLALVGANGSGKTTVLRLLAGLVPPTEGSLTTAPGTTVAYVAQRADHIDWLPITGREVLRMGTYRRRGLVSRLSAQDRELMNHAAERLEATGFLHRQYGDLSGGQRQRIRIAQALVQQPDLLLLDEPITGLDLASQQRILDVMDAETRHGTSVVITTHNLDEARHCDRVLLLANREVAEGPPSGVLTPELLRQAFGDRVLGDHAHHDHAHELLVVDEHRRGE